LPIPPVKSSAPPLPFKVSFSAPPTKGIGKITLPVKVIV
jgi:hypothetical protein